MSLTTPRLLLRPFAPDDLDALARLAADPEVMRYIGGGVEDREQVAQGLERAVRRWRDEGMSWWAVMSRQSGRLIGRCCLQHMRDLPEFEIGYALERACWGQGFGSEAVAAALQHAFRHLILESVVALTHPDNLRSRRLLERHGFSHESRLLLRGKHLDLFRLRRQEWERVTHSATPPPSPASPPPPSPGDDVPTTDGSPA